MRRLNIISAILLTFISWNISAQIITKPDTVFLTAGLNNCVQKNVLQNDSFTLNYVVNLVTVSSGLEYAATIGTDKKTVAICDTSIFLTSSTDTITYTACDSITQICRIGRIYIIKTMPIGDIYSGDANKDGKVDYLDILSVGAGYNNIGYPRHFSEIGNAFFSKNCNNWTDSIFGINSKYVDGNGDGVINDLDTQSVSLNYLLQYGFYNPRYSPIGNIPVYLKSATTDTFKVNTLDGIPDTFSLDVYIGDINTPATGLYGAGFQIEVDSTANGISIQDFKLNTSSTFVQNDPNFISFSRKQQSKKIDIALTRTNKTTRNNGGGIGTLRVVIDDVILGGIMVPYTNTIHIKNIALTNTLGIHPLGIQKTDYTLKAVSATSGITRSQLEAEVLYCSDIEGNVLIENTSEQNRKIEISDILGRKIKVFDIQGKSSVREKIEKEGIYILTVSAEGISKSYKLIKSK